MADIKISALTDLTLLADGDELPIADASDLTGTKSCTLATLRSYLQSIGGMLYVKRLGANANNSTTTMAEATDLTVTLAAGWWRFEYWLQVLSDTATNSFKLAVDHSGTTAAFDYQMHIMSNGVLTATGAWDQEVNATTGFIVSSFATRVKNTALGPGVSVDTISSELLVRINGVFQSTTSGDLKLLFASEIAGITTLNAASALLLHNLTNTV